MSNNEIYDKGFDDGYKAGKNVVNKEVDEQIKKINEKVDKTLYANAKHNEGERNG